MIFGGKMYVYLITNLINDKKYVGITNDYRRRWANHKNGNSKNMVIGQAIEKYGVKNFKFEIIEKNVPLDQIDEKEQYYIEYYQSHVSTNKGYNVSKGGRYNINNQDNDTRGHFNNNAHLTKEEVEYIKSHLFIPMYVLYDKFSEKLTYATFKDIYNDKTYKEIKPASERYPYNNEFSNQFTSQNKLSYEEVVELRKKYAQNIPWKIAYEDYKDLYPNEMSFWNIYVGNRYKLVMPEVFTKENKHFQSSISRSGEQNGRAKLTKEDVLNIRKWFESKEKTRKEIQQLFPQVTSSSINNIINYKTWKNINYT